MKFHLLLVLFLLWTAWAAKQKLDSNEQSGAYATNLIKGREKELANQARAKDSSYNQDQNALRSDEEEQGLDQADSDLFSRGNAMKAGKLSEIEKGREKERLAKITQKGARDKGRIRYEENQGRDRGTNEEDNDEMFKNKKLKSAGKSLNQIKTRATADKKSKAPTKSIIPSQYSNRLGFAQDLGNLNMYGTSLDEAEGRKKGRKASTYDKQNKGKKLDHIYDKQNWDNTALLYEGDKVYKKVKKADVKGRAGNLHAKKKSDLSRKKTGKHRNTKSNTGAATSREKNNNSKVKSKSLHKKQDAGSFKKKNTRIHNQV